jgi:3-oxochol-4-en-24-oyl-CoA dehydrogenase
MSIAITEDHRALGQTASDFLAKHDSRGTARVLLEAETETVPLFWGDLSSLGWLGLHLPEARGGSGFGLPELVVVVEELGRAVTPGPFVPTVIASAVIDEGGSDDLAARVLPGLADGSVLGGVGLTSDITVRDGRAAGTAPRSWAAASPTCSCCRRATMPSWSTRRRVASPSTYRPTSTRRGAPPG